MIKRLVKRTSLFFIVPVVLMTISSCKFGFESTKFYNQRRRNIDISIDAKQVDTSDPGTIEISADKENKIQELFSDAEKNKDTPFPASTFDGWVFYCVNLTDKNVGTYRFDNSGTWTDDGTFKGNQIGSGLRALTNVTYYRYKDRTARWQAVSYTDFDPFTPERDPDEKLKKREERFLFFRFTAQSKAGPLDNTMLCVDTYTKFCWYYAEPGWLQDILGNKVPKDWVDFEDPVIPTAKEVEHTKAYGKFYYYDPVGYVQEDGSVVLYEWAKNDLEAGYFNPRQNYKETATRTPEGAGKSPYFIHDAKENTTPEVSVPRHDAGLLVQMSYIKNESFTSLKQAVLSKNRHELSYVYLFAKTTNSISRDSIVFPNNKNTLECKKIALNETVGITANNSFLLKLSDLRAKGGFELKTETAFANELHKPLGGLIQGSKVGNELNRSAYGIASFTFVPAQGTEPARLRFNGIKNETYRKNDFSTEITASIEKDTYLPLNKSITLTLTYTVNGDIGASTLDKREAPVENARFSITYTLDFTDGK